ncbi:(2,3-dihydroxybenzoyl)adenylate synthase [Isoalcanivorax beigongshangi]|uniref:(2,3-dihydroxybenzoyl)adenylate synthase n=1 Tax=Isoalcanivorax beigongshangi TaxID=3238810 RepID=A0ABV4AEV5_9GAMM
MEFTPWPAARAAHYRAQGYWIDQPLTAVLSDTAQRAPHADALICGERRISYHQLQQAATRLAQWLTAEGLGPGDTALVQLPNVAEFYMVLFGLLQAGVAPVNALYSHRAFELNAFADQIRPRLIIGDRHHELFRTDDFLRARARQGEPAPCVLLLDAADAHHDLQRVLQQDHPAPVTPQPTAPDQVALFQLSGGSTGTPKLIPRTHNDYHYSVRASADICRLGPDTRYLCALPAPHNYSLSSPGALGVFHAGGCVVLAANPEPQRCFALIQRHRVTMAALVPSAVALWLDAAPSAQSLPSLQLLQVGGASFAEALARQVPERLGCRLQQVFGMAEGLVNYTRLDDPDELVFRSQGRPISAADEVRVLSADGEPVADGEAGLLATRGPYTFCGYYRSPEHNRSVFDADGFYFSGDLVVRDSDGNLRVVGRVKDQINRGGEKVASEEIEHLLLRHPDVLQAALVAVPDPLLGEKSCAFIVSRNPRLSAPQLRRHLLQLGIAEYKLPDRIHRLDQLPLTAVGKPDKNRLREQLAHC